MEICWKKMKQIFSCKKYIFVPEWVGKNLFFWKSLDDCILNGYYWRKYCLLEKKNYRSWMLRQLRHSLLSLSPMKYGINSCLFQDHQALKHESCYFFLNTCGEPMSDKWMCANKWKLEHGDQKMSSFKLTLTHFKLSLGLTHEVLNETWSS